MRQVGELLVADERRWPDFRGLGESRGAYAASRDQLVGRFEPARATELDAWTAQSWSYPISVVTSVLASDGCR
jgi:hypothetical protein